jgi:hypothetical protein
MCLASVIVVPSRANKPAVEPKRNSEALPPSAEKKKMICVCLSRDRLLAIALRRFTMHGQNVD